MKPSLSQVKSVDELQKSASATTAARAAGSSAFAQDGGLWRKELLSDLVAAVTSQPSSSSRNGWFARPGILRRVAALIGQSAPINADRIVAVGDYAEILGAAVALETGLPFCVMDSEADARLQVGELHTGERVVVVSVDLTCAALMEPLSDRGIEVLNWCALVYGSVDAPILSRDRRFSAEFSDAELKPAIRSEGK